MTEVSVSLLSSPEEMTEEALSERVRDLQAAGADSIHWDVMDGVYNPNNTWQHLGPSAIRNARRGCNLPFVAHLMIADPHEKIGLFDCDTVIFHYEACENAGDVIRRSRPSGRKIGIAVEPETAVERIEPYLLDVDCVLVMTVRTGYAGQRFIDKTDKVRRLAEVRSARGLDFTIGVDGGITDVTGQLCRPAGADTLVSASYVLRHPGGYGAAISSLK